MTATKFNTGDWVIYRKQKTSNSPGPRAKEVRASSGGESYHYMVDKFWIVEEVLDDGLKLRTRRGKRNKIPWNDPRLRTPSWWERLVYRGRFQEVEDDKTVESDA